MEFLVMILAGFHWEINLMAAYGISSNATHWVRATIQPLKICWKYGKLLQTMFTISSI